MAKNTSETASSPSWNDNGFWELWQEHLETRPFCEHTGYQTKQSDARMKKATLLRREMSIRGRVETVVTKS